MTQTCQLGILGYPLSHTLSPTLHQIFLADAGLHGEYHAYPTPPEALETTIAELQKKGLRGVNLTIPHKVAILPLLHKLDDVARMVQAVNTLVFEPDGTIQGFNTDIAGFLQSLPTEISDTLYERNALILGAGGASRAVIAGLILRGISGITLAVRNPEKAQAVIKLAHKLADWHEQHVNLHLLEISELSSLGDYSLVVNTTPIGLKSQDQPNTPVTEAQLKTFPAHGFISDLVYSPAETPLVHQCRTLNIAAKDGLDMLIYQGAEAFRLWTGVTYSEKALQTARKQLRSQSH